MSPSAVRIYPQRTKLAGTGYLPSKLLLSVIKGNIYKEFTDKKLYADYGSYYELHTFPNDVEWRTKVIIKRTKTKAGKTIFAESSLYECYCEVSKRICQAIIDEYKSYVTAGQAPGVASTSTHPAIARGEADMYSLINAPQLAPTQDGHYKIEVVNKVWLYQEFGFDMHGKLPPRPVAEKILEWAIQKGIVQGVKGFLESRGRQPKENLWKKWMSDSYEIGNPVSFKKRMKAIRLKPSRTRYSKEYWKLTTHDVQWIKESGSTEQKKQLDKFMWKITGAVVRNSDGRMNRRLFLTVAKRNIMGDRTFVKKIEAQCLKEYGFSV